MTEKAHVEKLPFWKMLMYNLGATGWPSEVITSDKWEVIVSIPKTPCGPSPADRS